MSSPQRVSYTLTTYFAQGIVNISASAIQVFMWFYIMSFQVEASKETQRRRLPYICASLAILGLSLASSVIWVMAMYYVTFEATPGLENLQSTIITYSKYHGKFLTVSSLLADLALQMGDMVLLYRCYLVWFQRWWVMIVPVCTFLASTGINLRTHIPLDFWDARLNGIDVFVLVGLNILLTSLISIRLVYAQRQLKAVLPESDHNVYLGIIAILVESAAPVAILGIALSVAWIYADRTFQGYQTALIAQILFIASAWLAPQLVIFRVTTGTSWADRAGTGAIFSQSIKFTPPITTKVDEEGASNGGFEREK